MVLSTGLKEATAPASHRSLNCTVAHTNKVTCFELHVTKFEQGFKWSVPDTLLLKI